MSERGLKDEIFVRSAYEEIEDIETYNLFHQAYVQGIDDSEVQASAHAAFVTAVNIYHAKGFIEERYIQSAAEAKTVRQVRDLIDELDPFIEDYIKKLNNN